MVRVQKTRLTAKTCRLVVMDKADSTESGHKEEWKVEPLIRYRRVSDANYIRKPFG